MRYFDSNNVEGVAESWVETEISWVEVGMSWVEVNGAGWKLVHGLVIPFKTHVNKFKFKKTVAILIFNSTCFTFFIIMSEFAFNSMNSSEILLTRFDNELAINLALSINCNM